MKWKNEIPNKTEFLKVNSFNFIQNEKVDSELVHELNFRQIQNISGDQTGQRITEDIKQTSMPSNSCSTISDDKENAEMRRTIAPQTASSETIILTKTETDFTGSAPKRYTSKCFLQPLTTPVWYTESLLVKIGSTKRIYDEKVYFKTKLKPFHWSETMSTEVNTVPKCILSEINIPVDDDEDDFHYISLEPQQPAAKSTEL